MNPYSPPIVATPKTQESRRGSLKNPARILLYPLAALFVLLSLATGWRFLQNGFQFRTVDFLNAGIGLLIGLFGTTAFFLGAKKLSKKTRVLTIVWSFATVSILVISMFFDPPASIRDVILIFVTGSILLLVAILAFRSVPQGDLVTDHNDTAYKSAP